MGAQDLLYSFFHHRLFNRHYETTVHLVQLFFIISMFIFTGVRLTQRPAGRRFSRSETMGFAMGAKSIIVLVYQLVTTHVDRFRRWASTKAYAILNCLEIVFWFAVVVLTFMSMSGSCTGVYCGLGFAVAAVGIILVVLAFWAAVVSVQNHRAAKMVQYKGSTGTAIGGYPAGVSRQVAPDSNTVKGYEPQQHSPRHSRHHSGHHSGHHSRHHSHSGHQSSSSRNSQSYDHRHDHHHHQTHPQQAYNNNNRAQSPYENV